LLYRLADGQLLDVLINNAGCYFDGNDRHVCSTNEEWEITFATNAIGPILLTDLLIENLKETASEKVFLCCRARWRVYILDFRNIFIIKILYIK